MGRFAGFYAVFAVMAFIVVIWHRGTGEDGRFSIGITPNGQQPELTLDEYGARELVIDQHVSGGYLTRAVVNGSFVEVLVDTGASFFTLPADQAERAGIRPGPGAPTTVFRTANGEVEAKRVTVDTLRLGPATLTNVTAYILPSDRLAVGLLGMNVLNEFGEVRFDRDALTITLE